MFLVTDEGNLGLNEEDYLGEVVADVIAVLINVGDSVIYEQFDLERLF